MEERGEDQEETGPDEAKEAEDDAEPVALLGRLWSEDDVEENSAAFDDGEGDDLDVAVSLSEGDEAGLRGRARAVNTAAKDAKAMERRKRTLAKTANRIGNNQKV